MAARSSADVEDDLNRLFDSMNELYDELIEIQSSLNAYTRAHIEWSKRPPLLPVPEKTKTTTTTTTKDLCLRKLIQSSPAGYYHPQEADPRTCRYRCCSRLVERINNGCTPPDEEIKTTSAQTTGPENRAALLLSPERAAALPKIKFQIDPNFDDDDIFGSAAATDSIAVVQQPLVLKLPYADKRSYQVWTIFDIDDTLVSSEMGRSYVRRVFSQVPDLLDVCCKSGFIVAAASFNHAGDELLRAKDLQKYIKFTSLKREASRGKVANIQELLEMHRLSDPSRDTWKDYICIAFFDDKKENVEDVDRWAMALRRQTNNRYFISSCHCMAGGVTRAHLETALSDLQRLLTEAG